jgi:hypothetical protein
MIDFTTVVALDERTIDQLRLTWPTWVRHRPEILERPLFIIVDSIATDKNEQQGTLILWGRRLKEIIQHPNMTLYGTPPGPWPSQREKMLTAFVLAPPMAVKTPWYLKIDADAVAMRSDPNWIQDEWFEPMTVRSGTKAVFWARSYSIQPAFVASSWGYSKPATAMETMDKWANDHPAFAGTKPLNLPYEPGASRVRHPRMASWVMFGSMEFIRFAASLCNNGRLPLPSQDGYVFYVAKRLGWPYRTVKMKRLGWTNKSRMASLRNAVAEAMQN